MDEDVIYQGVRNRFDGWEAYTESRGKEKSLGIYRTKNAAAVIHDLHVLLGIEAGRNIDIAIRSNLNFSKMLVDPQKNPQTGYTIYKPNLTSDECLEGIRRVSVLHLIAHDFKDIRNLDKVLSDLNSGKHDDVGDDIGEFLVTEGENADMWSVIDPQPKIFHQVHQENVPKSPRTACTDSDGEYAIPRRKRRRTGF